MKKIFALLLIVVASFSLSACEGKSTSIDPTIWVMSSIQSTSDGAVTYCSAKEKDNFPEADVRDISCNIDGSTITIRNNETSEEWNGTYKLLDSNDERTIYEVTIEGEKCQAVKSVTEYENDAGTRDTLILSCKDYVLNFFDK